jgi:hypothetical protein
LKEGGAFLPLAQILKQIDAPVGQLGLSTLRTSTTALESGTISDDSTYSDLENQLLSITTQRNALAAQILWLLEGAEFKSQAINKATANQLIKQAQTLLNQAQ